MPRTSCPSRLFSALPRLVLAATLAGVLGGCQLLAPRTAQENNRLPSLPRASRTVGPGAQVTFHEATFQVMGIAPEAVEAVSLSVRQGRRTNLLQVGIGDFAISGDYLVRFTPRPDAREADLLLMTLYHLPTLLPSQAKWPAERRLAPQEMLPFHKGFVLVEQIVENDFLRTDDDAARILLFRQGHELEDVNLAEFHRIERDGLVISAANVFPGDDPSQGIANLRVEPADSAWPSSLPREQTLMAEGEQKLLPDYLLTVEALHPNIERVHLTVDSGENMADLFLLPGGSARWERLEVRADAITAQGAQLTIFTHEEAIQPADRRLTQPSAAQQAREEALERATADPTTRRMIVGQSETYAGADFTLLSVRENNAMDLFDDSAEFSFSRGDQIESFVLREGSRHTVRSDNQWWVLNVREATPGSTPSDGKVVIGLETGSFYRMGED